jgi:hypothetical protein
MTADSIFWIGIIALGILSTCGFLLLLRNNKILFILFILTLIMAIIGVVIRGENTKMINGNAADNLLGPFIYICSYMLLRHLYKTINHKEPTFNRYSWHSEGRKQNWLDVSTYITPMILGFVIPVIIGLVFK